jgi:hypothetical protein
MRKSTNPAALAWVAFGSLIALGITALFVRELPSIRRELRILRM